METKLILTIISAIVLTIITFSYIFLSEEPSEYLVMFLLLSSIGVPMMIYFIMKDKSAEKVSSTTVETKPEETTQEKVEVVEDLSTTVGASASSSSTTTVDVPPETTTVTTETPTEELPTPTEKTLVEKTVEVSSDTKTVQGSASTCNKLEYITLIVPPDYDSAKQFYLDISSYQTPKEGNPNVSLEIDDFSKVLTSGGINAAKTETIDLMSEKEKLGPGKKLKINLNACWPGWSMVSVSGKITLVYNAKI